MKSDSIKQYVQLRQNLETERQELTSRLLAIEAALGTKAVDTKTTVTPAKVRKSVKRAQNKLSLKEAIIQVTAKAALTKHEILEALQKIGYQFSTKNPLNSIGTVLYGKKPKFKNTDGKFCQA